MADAGQVAGNDVSSLTTPFVVNTLICIAALVTFSWATKRYEWCYRPRIARPDARDTRGRPPGIDTTLPWQWIRAVFTLSEETLLDTVGLDATMFLQFFDLGLRFFTPLAFIGLALMIPLNSSADPLQPGDDGFRSDFNLDRLNMSNIRKSSPVFWAHLLFSYALTAYLAFLLRRQYRIYVHLRHRYFLSPGHSGPRPEQLSVMVQNVPTHLQSDDVFKEYMTGLYPDSLTSAVIAKDTKELQGLIDERETALRKLESAVAAFELGGQKHRPICRVGVTQESKDAIDYWSERLNILNNAVVDVRSKPLPPTSNGFASFQSFVAASTAAQVRQTIEPGELETCIAPEPREVFWPALRFAENERAIRGLLVAALMSVLILFWVVPVTAISALSSLSKLQETFPWLEPVLDYSPAVKGFLEGFLPTLALLLFQLLLPPLLLFLSQQEGLQSLAWLEIGVFQKFFLFQFFAFFLASVVSKSLLSSLQEIASEPGKLPYVLSNGLAGQSTTFTAYVLLSTFSRLPLRLLRLGALTVGSLKMKFLVKTAHDLKCATDPGSFQFGADYPMQLFVFLIGLVYAPISPMILPFTAMFFAVGIVVFRYLFVFVFEPKYESGGRLWPLVFARIIAGAIIAQITLIGMFALRAAPQQSSLMIPLPLLTFYFFRATESRYGDSAERLSRSEMVDLDAAEAERLVCGTAYKAPCEYEPRVNVDEVKDAIVNAVPNVQRLPEPGAIRKLVELDVLQSPKALYVPPVVSGRCENQA